MEILIVMEYPNHPNDPNVPECEQVPAAPDGFAPQWIGRVANGSSDAPEGYYDCVDTYEVGGPSTVAIEGPSFPLPAPGLPVPPTVIEDLGTRLGNIEYRHGVLTKKMEEVSDAEVADNIAIREIHPRVTTVGEQIQVESRVDPHPNGQMVLQGQEVIVGSNEQVQTLQTILHETELQNQQLQTRVTEMESRERLTVLEKRLPGPPPGPQ
nr:hypothetical protein [Tanacetum cinerariifolium]